MKIVFKMETKVFKFAIRYETRTVVITGDATVIGEYDGPSKPEAMVRAALNDQDNLQVLLTHESSLPLQRD